MTVLTITTDYRGGKGFVTTEQARPTANTLTIPVGFWVDGQPVPKTGGREPKGLPGWQGRVQQAARMQRVAKGNTGAFQPVSVILQFATDEADAIDLLCRGTLDALVHSGIIHDDSNVIDLVATRRPVEHSPTQQRGVHVVVIPGELLYGKVLIRLNEYIARAPHYRRVVMQTPRTEPDKKGADGSRVGEWKNAVKASFSGVHLADGPITLVCEFMLPRWLEPTRIHYPVVNGRDIDRESKSTRLALGRNVDVTDVVASKRLQEPAHGIITIAPGSLLSSRVISSVLAGYEPFARWSEALN